MPVRLGQQRGALAVGHRHPRGALAAGRDVEQVDPLEPARYLDPGIADREVPDRCSTLVDQRADVGFAGVFQTDRALRAAQQLENQMKRLLLAHGDEDFVGSRCNPPPGEDLLPELLDQQLIVGLAGIGRPAFYLADSERHAARLAPLGDREKSAIVEPFDEGIGKLTPVCRVAQSFIGDHAIGGLAHYGRLHTPRFWSGDSGYFRCVTAMRDIHAASLARDQMARSNEILVGQRHRISGDAEFTGQLSRRWKLQP